MPARPVPRAQHDQHHDDHDHSTFPHANQVAHDEWVAQCVAEAQAAPASAAGDEDQQGQGQAEANGQNPPESQPMADGQEAAGDAGPAARDGPAEGTGCWYPRGHWLNGYADVRDEQVSSLSSAPPSLSSEFQLLSSIVEAGGASLDDGAPAASSDQGAGVGFQEA